jgi:hypothetical protein
VNRRRQQQQASRKFSGVELAFGILFILTGVFAIAGGLYTWGDGSIFSKTELLTVLIPWADIILTGPISLKLVI